MIRTDYGCSISRFAELVGVPRRTYHARLARLRAGEVPKGPWPAPVVDRIEATVAKYAAEWPAWGHRKIAAIAAADGADAGSPASVSRAMARRDLLQPVRYQAERRQLAQARREAFVEAPVRPNRVWQADFTQFETTSEGTWRLCPVVDYATKLALACPVSTTQGATDRISALQSAVQAAEALLAGHSSRGCVDGATGEVDPPGGCDRQRPGHGIRRRGPLVRRPQPPRPRADPPPSAAHQRRRRTLDRDPGIRTPLPPRHRRRHRPRRPVADFTDEYNTIRPHQALDQTPPLAAYLQARALKPNPPKTEQKT